MAVEILLHGVEIGFKDDKIFCLGISLEKDPSTRIIDADGVYITPGVVDLHAHFAQANSPAVCFIYSLDILFKLILA